MFQVCYITLIFYDVTVKFGQIDRRDYIVIHFGESFLCLTQKHVPQQVAIIVHMFIVSYCVIISCFVLICRNSLSQEIDTEYYYYNVQ